MRRSGSLTGRTRGSSVAKSALDAAASLTRRTMGLIIPRGTRFIRCGVAIVNLFQRLRRHPFRVYVHDPGEVEAVLGRHGLRRQYLREGVVWRVAVFTVDAR